MKKLRAERDALLSQTDKYATIDFPHGSEAAKQAWLDYRQALRDLPANTTDVATPVWPIAPDAEFPELKARLQTIETQANSAIHILSDFGISGLMNPIAHPRGRRRNRRRSRSWTLGSDRSKRVRRVRARFWICSALKTCPNSRPMMKPVPSRVGSPHSRPRALPRSKRSKRSVSISNYTRTFNNRRKIPHPILNVHPIADGHPRRHERDASRGKARVHGRHHVLVEPRRLRRVRSQCDQLQRGHRRRFHGDATTQKVSARDSHVRLAKWVHHHGIGKHKYKQTHRAFNEDTYGTNERWVSQWVSGTGGRYDRTTGFYDGATYDDCLSTSSGTPEGEWLAIQVPEAFVLHSFEIVANSSTNSMDDSIARGQAPRDFQVWASNNGTAWTKVFEIEDADAPSGVRDGRTFYEWGHRYGVQSVRARRHA